MEPRINSITGKQDGIIYTFGKTDVCIILAEILLSLPDNRKKFHTVASKLTDFTEGLRTLSTIPKDAPMRGVIALDWRDKYLRYFEGLLTVEEGQSFLLNLAKTRYKEIIVRS